MKEYNFPIVLYTLLRKNKMKQYELADEIEVSDSTVSSWQTERTRPSIEDLIRMSAFFHVSIDYLITGGEYGT